MIKALTSIFFTCLILSSSSLFGQALDEYKIKRKDIFVFTKKPTLIRNGDDYSISFSVKDFCDVTVVIEDSKGKILRHLASGVLGKNPPPLFKANSLDQVIKWNGKNDEGKYVEGLENVRVRVSLGLKPAFDKKLYTSPYKRIAKNAPLLAVDKSGMYSFEGQGIEFLKKYDHEGNYLKTIYPFPANKIKDVKGLKYFTSLKDGKRYPKKLGYNQSTFLTSGTSAIEVSQNGHAGGYAATAMAVHNGHIALAYNTINRLGTDGTTKGLELSGPTVGVRVRKGRKMVTIGPTSIAFSPDNKYLYLTGYVYKSGYHPGVGDALHAVFKIEYAKNSPPVIFAGKRSTKKGVSNDKNVGSDNKSFCVPTSVAVDAKGRVYVSDFGNNRIQIFQENGTFIKSIPIKLPAKVYIDPKTQEIYSFSWPIIGASAYVQKKRKLHPTRVSSTISNLGTFEKPKKAKPEKLPVTGGSALGGRDTGGGGQVYEVVVNSYSKKQSIWVSAKSPTGSRAEFAWGGKGILSRIKGWAAMGIKAFKKIKGKWVCTTDFAKKAIKEVKQINPPSFNTQRLHFNPSDGCLYVAEDIGGHSFDKTSNSLVKINPETGDISRVNLPFDAADDIVFWYNDIAYLRTHYAVMRFNSKTWKEIPWDYGNEYTRVHSKGHGAPKRSVRAMSALAIPGRKPVNWQLGGMNINAKGHLAVMCYIPKNRSNQYPGRSGRYIINVFDAQGKIFKQDALPGIPGADGFGIDINDDLYVMMRANRYIPGKKRFTQYTKTLTKTKLGKSRILGDDRSPLPLTKDIQPKRPIDFTFTGGTVNGWIENVEWMYGGVGHGGQQACACWHGGFSLDLLGRSFVSEINQYQVAVIDSNGNLILRLGKYSNADSYGAKSPVPLGGDEVGIMAAYYIGVETDKRVFISDLGNQRILSVKLNYAVNETLPIPKKKPVNK